MIVLDTNVVSEAMKASAEPRVIAWLNDQAPEALYLTSVALAELLFGIACLDEGRRKTALATALSEVLLLFDGRILPFDEDASRHYADLASRARSAGRGLPKLDGYIAAVASANGFAVATRDASPFEAAGVTVIDPWA